MDACLLLPCHAKFLSPSPPPFIFLLQVDTIRAKNQAELLELRDSAKKLYEQENRGYQTDRDSSKAARLLAEAELREISERFDTLQASYRLLQVNSECGMSELRSSLKMKTFEVFLTWA